MNFILRRKSRKKSFPGRAREIKKEHIEKKKSKSTKYKKNVNIRPNEPNRPEMFQAQKKSF